MKTLNFLTIAFFVLTLVGCSTQSDKKIHKFDQMAGKKIVIQQGTTFEAMLKEKYPTFDVIKVPTSFDVFKTVIGGIAEYGIDEDISAIQMMSNGLSIDTSHIDMPPVPMGAIFNKSNVVLQQQFNVMIDSLEKCGRLDEIREKWFSSVTPSSIPIPECKVKRGEPLRAVTEADYPPFNMMVSGKVSGFDIELMTIFAESLGRPLEVSAMAFDNLIPHIAASKADFAIAGISITKDRAEKVLFSKPYNYTYTTIVFLKEE
ncbi:MAG: transporter substrate-binding domain-containing protein [Bacteroidales bacterium]|nr:transporter substrate-binding domain-containing protein [Bacteroidales bacterium]